MKISVSVPDDLWSEAAQDETSPSQVVQLALSSLVDHRRAGESRVVEFEARLDSRMGTGGEDAGSGWTAPILDRLVAGALELRDDGYRMGIQVADRLTWVALEDLPTGSRLQDALVRWADGDDTIVPIGSVIYNVLQEWEVGVSDGDPVASDVLYEGMAAALDDVRAAVRERMRSGATIGGKS